jgi:hypothetical protein
VGAPVDEFDTSSNKRTMGDSKRPKNRGIEVEAEQKFAPHEPGTTERLPKDGEPTPPDNIAMLVKSAYTQGINYQQNVLQPKWRASAASYNNQHFTGSKYLSPRYRGRTHLFRPKTRSAIRRKSAEAAMSLFQTNDVVIVSPGNEADEAQRASAAINKELLNYRLTVASENVGIPWFLVSMGAHQTAQIYGVVTSKQRWEYKEKILHYEEVTYSDGSTEMQPVTQIVRDRPWVDLYAPEDVIRDPGANWLNQAQDSAYFILKNSMTLSDARVFLQQIDKDGQPMFDEVSEEELAAAAGVRSGQADSTDGVRRARETTGYDRLHDANADREFMTVWLHENFMRIDGEDWNFWTLGVDKVISPIRLVAKVYPEQGGARPITVGVGALDAFKIDPMSAVEAWSPVQQEINDVVNLRLEVMKQTVSPVTKVRRGRQISLKEVQNRSPDSVIYVDDMKDVEFDRPGSVGQEAFIEMERLNTDFDELAGTFSVGSVQSNGLIHKTATGIQAVSGSANAMGEFDLRVWVETWAEDCLRQVMKLEQYYEADERVLAIAGDKAKLRQKFNTDKITDALLTQQVTLRINIGIGASDPMVRLQKLGGALEMLTKVAPTALQRLRQDPLIEEIFGVAGYKDAVDRFFYPGDDHDPRIQDMGQQLQQLEGQLQDKQADRDNKVQIAQIGAVKDVVNTHLQHRQNLVEKRADFAMGEAGAMREHAQEQENTEGERNFQREQGETEHARQVDMKGKDAQVQDYMAKSQGERREASEQRQLVAKTAGGVPAKSNSKPPGGDVADLRQLLGLGGGNDDQLVQTIMQGFQQLAEMQMRNDRMMMQAMAKIAEGIGSTAEAVDASNREITGAVNRMGREVVQAVKNKPKAVFDFERGADGFTKRVRQVN